MLIWTLRSFQPHSADAGDEGGGEPGVDGPGWDEPELVEG